MIQQIILIVAGTFALWWSFKQGEIFGVVQKWFASLTPRIKKPLFDCPVCMAPWWGTLFYWLLYGNPFTGSAWQHWLTVIIACVGVCAIIIKLAPCCDE